MRKNMKRRFGLKKALPLVAGLAMLALAGCDTPEEKAQSHYENGLQLFKEENYVKAGLEFRNALQLNGNLADAWYHLALVEEKDGKFREYAGDLYKTIELDSQHVPAHVRLAKILLFSGRIDEAAEKSELVLRLAPEDADVWALKSAVLFKQENIEEAKKAARKALEFSGTHVEASLVLAIQATIDNKPDEALQILDNSLSANKDNVPLQMAKMQALEKKGDKAGIEKVFRELIASNPDQVAYRNNLTRFYLKEGQKDKAEAEIRAIAADNPDDYSAKLNIVRFMRSLGGNEAAKKELENMIAENPSNAELKFSLVEILLQERKQDEAKAILNSLVEQKDADDAGLEARNRLAEITLREGKKEDAKVLIDEVLVQDNRNVVALMLRAAMEIDEGKVDNAITNLRAALKEQPDSVKATLLLARAHEMTGAVELAEDRFSAAFKMSKGKPRPAISYARFLQRRGEYDRAEETLQRSLDLNRDNPGLLISLAQTKLIREDWEGAEEIALKLKELNKNNVISDQILGRSYAGQKDLEKSLQAFEKAHESTPNGINTMLALVRLHLSNGEPEKALETLDGVIEASPKNFAAKLLKGQVLNLQGREEEAIKIYQDTLKEDPKLQAAYYMLFTHYTRKGSTEKAEQILANGLEALPESYTLQLLKAGLLERQEKFEEAIGYYEKMLASQPNADVVINNLASLISTVYSDEENLRKAYSYAKRFRSSKIPHFKDTLGWIHYKLGEYELATPLLEEAVKQLPTFALLRYHLGMSLLAENRKARALEELTKALELSNNNPTGEMKDIKKTLEGLKAS